MDLYIHSPHTPSCAYLVKSRENFTFTYIVAVCFQRFRINSHVKLIFYFLPGISDATVKFSRSWYRKVDTYTFGSLFSIYASDIYIYMSLEDVWAYESLVCETTPGIMNHLHQNSTYLLGEPFFYNLTLPVWVYLIFSFRIPKTRTGAKISQSVGRLATGWTTEGVGVRVPTEAKIFSSLRRPDRLWGTRSFLSNGHRGIKAAGLWSRPLIKLMPRSRKRGYIHSTFQCTSSWRIA
jgi:hypothetical protein